MDRDDRRDLSSWREIEYYIFVIVYKKTRRQPCREKLRDNLGSNFHVNKISYQKG